MIEPFGTNNSSVNIPVQKLFGATVAKFTASTDYASQPGTCTIDLIEDDVDGDRFTPSVIGSPVFFKVVDVEGDTIFEYNGLLDTITRDTRPNDKTYRVTLMSPLKILESVTLILKKYTGYGTAYEGFPRYFSEDGYYTISEGDKQPGYLPDGVSMVPTVDYFEVSQLAFGTNNSNLTHTGMWSRIYNLINVFGAYENESLINGDPVGITPYNGFGASSAIDGMRVDKIAYAIDQLVNYTHSSDAKRYLGGNLLFGTNTYNVCATAVGYIPPLPFFYGIDIIDFVSYLLYFLPEDFVVEGDSITLSEFIGTVCDAANCDFVVELNDENYKEGVFAAQMQQTYPLSVFGGIISITLIPRNVYVDCNKPFNNFTSTLLNLEKPDMGDYGIGNVNPGVLGGEFLEPLDENYTNRGTEGSFPYGGKFPVETPADSNGTLTDVLNRAENINVSLKSSHGTTGKFVIGDFQTRMNVVPRNYIYQYWGEILITNKSKDSCGIFHSSQKSIPVITQILPPNDIWDWIAIDIQDIVGSTSVANAYYNGVYFASMMELRSALCDKESWTQFMKSFKKEKTNALRDGVNAYLLTSSSAQLALFSDYGKAIGLGTPSSWWSNNKNKSFSEIEDKIYEKIRNIASTHYGRSWVAPIPLFQTKRTSDNDNIVGNFVRSWDVSDSAYVEPYLFGTIEAPKDSLFNDQGRLKAYVNFEHSFTAGSGDIGYDTVTDDLYGFISGVKYSFDFSSYSPDAIVYDFDPTATGSCPIIGLAHVTPNEINPNYLFVNPNYFEYYNRGHCPFIDSVGGTGELLFGTFYSYTYDFPKKDINNAPYNYASTGLSSIYESVLNDPTKKTHFGEAATNGFCDGTSHYSPCDNIFNNQRITYDCEVFSSTITTLNSGEASFSPRISGPALITIVNGMLNNGLDYGSGFPFVKFTTEFVGYPTTMSASNVNPLSSNYLSELNKAFENAFVQKINDPIGGVRGNMSAATFNNDNLNNWSKNCTHTPAVAPRSIAIPQKSNRYVYGPWVSNFSDIVYAGKFEYVQDNNLAPENFLLPVYGTSTVQWQVLKPDGTVDRVVEDITGTNLSGFAGLNLAGQAIANSIDDFSLFAQEEGNITIPGLPLISKVGQFLLDGPRITDVTLDFNDNNIVTTYNFRSLTPRLGKQDRELVKRLRKISNTLNATET